MSGQRVTVTLDRERELRYDLNAMTVIEEHGGLDETKPNSISNLRLLLFAGLLHEDETLTLQQVGGMVLPRKLPVIAEAVSRALERDHAEPEADAEAKPKPRPSKAHKRG